MLFFGVKFFSRFFIFRIKFRLLLWLEGGGEGGVIRSGRRGNGSGLGRFLRIRIRIWVFILRVFGSYLRILGRILF